MSKIKAYLILAYVFLVVPIVIALMYLFPKHQRVFRQKCGRLFLFLFRIKVRLEGVFATDVDVVVLNHQSFLDVIFLEAFHPADLCWVAKKELGEPKLYGHALKAPKMILLDREDRRSLILLLKMAQERLQQNRILAIFPEGTRSNGEAEFLPFKAGAKILIEKQKLRFQPIVVVNTKNIFDVDKLLFNNGEALFVALEPEQYIPSDSEASEWYDDLKNRMHECYLKNYNNINHHE